MAEQDVFARDGGVGLELEAPVAVRALAIEQRLRRRGNALVEILPIRRRHTLFPIMTTSAARLPDRTALSNVAGNPVAVQSPARTRLSQGVRAPGRLAFSSGVAAKVARRSRTICHGGNGSAGSFITAATSRQMHSANSARGRS